MQATTAEITNARADHSEDIGVAPDAAAAAVRWAVPVAGTLVMTTEAATATVIVCGGARRRVRVVDTAGSTRWRGPGAGLAVRRHYVPAAIAAPMNAAAPTRADFSSAHCRRRETVAVRQLLCLQRRPGCWGNGRERGRTGGCSTRGATGRRAASVS